MNLNIGISQSPHIKNKESTKSIMFDVIIALIPICIWSIYVFGFYCLLIIILSILASILSETIFNIILKRENTINDLSCIVTGIILALNMPPRVPLFVPFIGSVFAIIIVKMLFGGLGQNFMNPALAGRCFCLISFAKYMNNFDSSLSIDAYSSATPLIILKSGKDVSLYDLFFGYVPGSIGEISKFLILIGAIYLLIKKVIDLNISLTYLLTFILFIMIFNEQHFNNINYILAEVLSGGLIFGAFFMATDYSTSPISKHGMVFY